MLMKKIITTYLLIPFFTSSFAMSWEGKGTETDPYQIDNAIQLAELANEVNKGNDFYNSYFLLTQNIDLSETCNKSTGNWVPIGSPKQYFEGTLLGNNKTISNLYFDERTGDSYYGLFGYIGEHGTVDGIILEECQLHATAWIGGIAGANNGRISNCIIRSGSISSWEFAGGIVGTNFNLITNCENHATINSSMCSGGICGYNYGSVMICKNFGGITANEGCGGIVGFNGGFKNRENCYDIRMGFLNDCHNDAMVGGSKKIGGVTGRNDGFIINSSNTGEITGDNEVGGLSGFNGGFDGVTGHISNSYNKGIIISNNSSVGGIIGYSNTYGEVYNVYSTYTLVSFEPNNSIIGTDEGKSDNCFFLNATDHTSEVVNKLNQWVSVNDNEYFSWAITQDSLPTFGSSQLIHSNDQQPNEPKLLIITGNECVYIYTKEQVSTPIFTIEGKLVREIVISPHMIHQIHLKKGIYTIGKQKTIVY